MTDNAFFMNVRIAGGLMGGAFAGALAVFLKIILAGETFGLESR